MKTLSPSPAAAALMSFICTSRRRECAEEDDHHRGDPVLQINGKGLPERCNVHRVNCVRVGKEGGWEDRRVLNVQREAMDGSFLALKKVV